VIELTGVQGLIRAMEEHGIPIDHIAGELAAAFEVILHDSLCIGTSIGAFIGGLYAREGDIITSTGRAKQFSGRMGNIWRILSDVTYPIVAYTTVRHISNPIEVS
jgi:lysophospholipid hydrolase